MADTRTGIAGSEGKLYRNTGTYGTPVLSEISNIRDLDYGLDWGTAEFKSRGETSKKYKKTQSEETISFQLEDNPSDSTAAAHFTAIQAAAASATDTVELWDLDGAHGTEGSKGPRIVMQITKFERAMPLEDTSIYNVEAKPARDDEGNGSTWYTDPG